MDIVKRILFAWNTMDFNESEYAIHVSNIEKIEEKLGPLLQEYPEKYDQKFTVITKEKIKSFF